MTEHPGDGLRREDTVNKRSIALLLALALAAASLLGVAGCSADEPAAEAPASGDGAESESVREEYLVSIDELAGDPEGFVVIDARSPEAYAAGHIPGAVNAPWQTFADMEGAPGDPDWGTLLPAAQIGEKLGELGIDADRPIVVYADPTGWGEDGRVVWTLLSAGISDVRMLDGGWPLWSASGKDVSTDEVVLPATTVATAAELDADLNVTTDYLAENLERLQVVDSRSSGEYEGATDFGEKRGGHLPGAVSVPFPELFNDDGTVKSDADLRELFSAAGLEQDSETVFYCTKGIRSGLMTLLARMVGFDEAKNYDASIYTWAGDPDLPLE